MVDKEWFKEWFDSHYYHLLYQSRDEKEAHQFIQRLIGRFALKKGLKIIDIACGKGRHSKFISTLGFDVTGIDLSAESITYAQKDENKNLHFARHDMREVFRPNYFDVALNLFTSFGYFESEEENKKAIQAMADNLVRQGHLVIDFLNVKKVIKTLPVKEQKTIENITFNIEKFLANGYITKEIAFDDEGRAFHFTEYVKNIQLHQFQEYLNLSGLEIIHTFGDYHLNSFDETTSDRLILICKKN
ncbi:class I SAM-dependent methyltransferase [Acidiluteibacter ferrifornacis]|jgi:SAM-dependent methyltransferase|uniref:Methyltransferase domain-containing protein n=1 Tax=Acidiluteibacter ferrifornacis TaxID=2692424 RepID=A0A6N9NQ22_9FLAO|nr:class I SAM-dependent methyltransferase [Acidiluteibacter ferrifornacis]NBG66495.1 methyltransferase domain-containing protein [Acidiluteibacter ferrifornacis]